MKKIDYYKPTNTFPQEFISKEPNWILRSGISIVGVVVAILLLGSLLIRYPDKVTSGITITSVDPPIRISNQSSGVIDSLYVKDGDSLQAGQILYFVNDGFTRREDIESLKAILRISLDSIISYPFQNQYFLLGEIQSAYQDFYNQIIEYKEYVEYNPDMLQVTKLEASLREYTRLGTITQRKITIQDQKLQLQKKQFDRLVELNDEGVISNQEKETGSISYLERKEDLENDHINQANIEMKILELNKEIIDLKAKHKNALLAYQEGFNNRRLFLANAINRWETSHIVRAPHSGTVSFLRHDIVHAQVERGDKIVAVIPFSGKTKSEIIGKMIVPILNSGKIRIGKEVKVYLDNYPYQDYGSVDGVVETISRIPENNAYLIRVRLPNRLKTSQYNIPFNEELMGKAEIFLDQKSLFERFFQKIFYIKKNDTEPGQTQSRAPAA